MSLVSEKVLGKLILLNEDLSCLKYGTPTDFVKKLTELLAVEFPDTDQADLIVIGHNTPSEEDKGRPWFRTDTKNNFLGIYFFQGGSWKRVHNYRSDEVIWTGGDSRKIPKGFELITQDSQIFDADTRRHIVSMYRKDPVASTSTTSVYTYYALRWVGF